MNNCHDFGAHLRHIFAFEAFVFVNRWHTFLHPFLSDYKLQIHVQTKIIYFKIFFSASLDFSSKYFARHHQNMLLIETRPKNWLMFADGKSASGLLNVTFSKALYHAAERLLVNWKKHAVFFIKRKEKWNFAMSFRLRLRGVCAFAWINICATRKHFSGSL